MVKTGLQPDDVIIINGILKVRPESQVKPQQGTMEQFSSNDLVLPLTNSKGTAAQETKDGSKGTP